MASVSGAKAIGSVGQIQATFLDSKFDDDFDGRFDTMSAFAYTHVVHTNYALVQYKTDVVDAQWGKTSQVEVDGQESMVHTLYLEMVIPGLYPVIGTKTFAWAHHNDGTAAAAQGEYVTDEEAYAGMAHPIDGFWAHWINSLGFFGYTQIEMLIGGTVVSTLTAEGLYMLEELDGNAGLRLYDMIGQFDTREHNIAVSRYQQKLYTPLPFFCHTATDKAFSFDAGIFSKIVLRITTRDITKVIMVSNSDINVKTTNNNDVANPGVSTGTNIAKSDITLTLYHEHVLLDSKQRADLQASDYDVPVMIHAIEEINQTLKTTNTVEVRESGGAPLVELLFCMRLDCNFDHNDLDNFSVVGPAEGSGSTNAGTGNWYVEPRLPHMRPYAQIVDYESNADPTVTKPNLIADDGSANLAAVITPPVLAEPFQKIQIQIGSVSLTEVPGVFQRSVEAHRRHKRISSNFVYSHSFSVDPENTNPVGEISQDLIGQMKIKFTNNYLVAQSTSILANFYIMRRLFTLLVYSQQTAGTIAVAN